MAVAIDKCDGVNVWLSKATVLILDDWWLMFVNNRYKFYHFFLNQHLVGHPGSS